LQKAVVEREGLRGDRRFMLVDAQGKFITQRTRPELTRFKLDESDHGFMVKDSISGLEKELILNPTLGTWIAVEIWEDQLQAQEVLDGWSSWFSEVLKEDVKLVCISAENPREMKPKHQTDLAKNTSFADSLPLLVIGSASYQALEDRLTGPVDRLRFRPNIIVNSTEPFVEDTWVEIKVGEVRLYGAKPCARCSLVNVDPLSGESDKETLKSLASFRTINHKVYFGQQFVPISLGTIQVGSALETIETKDAIY
jgi:uncharacterized protein YcbX